MNLNYDSRVQGVGTGCVRKKMGLLEEGHREDN